MVGRENSTVGDGVPNECSLQALLLDRLDCRDEWLGILLLLYLFGLRLDRARLNRLHVHDCLHSIDLVLTGLGGILSRVGDTDVTVTHHRHPSTALVLTSSGHADMSNWALELNQRVGLVVSVERTGFAVGAKIGVIADGALVANSTDVGRICLGTCAKRAIAANTDMNCADWARADNHELIVDGHEAMVGMSEVGVKNAACTVIPIRAFQTLVTHTSDVLQRLLG